mmetsp:Transcript_105917/g.257316  ORF Transcript_105917/g.257316 Transcript_105917/m.257316 type:complete len:235 (+) Transcript_105917:429-1133(+)
MHVQHGLVTGRKQARDVKQHHLCLELGDNAARTVGAAQYEALLHVLFADTLELDGHILARSRAPHFRLVDEDAVDRAFDVHGLNLDGVSHTKGAGLDLAESDDTPVAVLIQDGNAQRGVRVATSHGQVVKLGHEGVACPPRALFTDRVFDVRPRQAGDGQEVDELLHVVPSLLQEGRQLLHDCIVAFLRPLDSGVIHLVDNHNKLSDAEGLGQHGVLPRLAAALETSLKLALAG